MIPVYLGRFAPLHLGHQKIIDKLIDDFGIEKIILMIGSSNVINEKTPYKVNFREKLIKSVYPKIKTYQIPDFQDDEKWLNYINSIENKHKDDFVFFGGSSTDLKILNNKFKTKVLINRNFDKISATKVREALKNSDFSTVKKLIDPKVYKYLI